MVRRDDKNNPNSQEGGLNTSSCPTPTGESPESVSVGAPNSRPQVDEGDLYARAGCQKPVMRREPQSGEQARGPQHKVKPAASTELQTVGRAAHVTAKATSLGREPKRPMDCGGVGGAARVQGVERPDGHPNSPTCGHLKFPHPERGEMTV